MSTIEKTHNDAMIYLKLARQEMMNLAACTSDLSSKVMLECEFEELEITCEEFGKCQFGIGVARIKRRARV